MKQSALIALLCVTSAVGADFDHLRRSIVRIQAVHAEFDWLRPFQRGLDRVGTGSGFVVQASPYPLFVTNAHVVNDARQVSLQLLVFGEKQWAAEVVSVCTKFDLALLVLREPAEFTKALAAVDLKLEALELQQRTVYMGQDVVALGFPLGQDALKISKGNVAGNEEVDGNICIQSTAPISPGSSGGPLLNADGSAVVGVNFAKAAKGENINYVIPAWRVRQLIARHHHDQPASQNSSWQRVKVQVASPQITTIEANDALYAMSEGCTKGVYISRVSDRSFFRYAKPPVPENAFLVSANGVELDQFGMGLNKEYAADRVKFTDIFKMTNDLYGEVQFETCARGKVTKHTASMDWRPEYDRGISFVDEPYIRGEDRAFETFGDVQVMEMTVNHVQALVSTTGNPSSARWLHPDVVSQPRLVINFVKGGSYASHFLAAGAVVKKLNGAEVGTLDDFRLHFAPKNSSKVWTLETDTGSVYAAMFAKTLSAQLQEARATNQPYLISAMVAGAATKLGLDASLQKGNLTLKLPALVAARQSVLPGRVVDAAVEVHAAGPLAASKASPDAPRTTRFADLPRIPGHLARHIELTA